MEHKTKFVIVVVLLVLSVMAFITFNSNTESGSDKTVDDESSLASEHSTANEKLGDFNQPVEPQKHSSNQYAKQQNFPKEYEKQLAEDWQDNWLAQMAERRYSEDTSVELTSLGMEYQGCGNESLSWLKRGRNLSDKQTDLISQIEEQCEDLAVQYPLLTSDTHYFNTTKVFPPTTELGQLLTEKHSPNSHAEWLNHSSQLIPLSIQAKNAQMLILARWSDRFKSQMEPFEASLINSQNNEYLNHLNSITLTALSCDYQNGITCAPTSSFMRDKCMDAKQFCGIDFQTWYDQSITPGMAKDVEILKQHYLQQAAQLQD